MCIRDSLSEKLQRAFKTLRGQAVLNEENIQEALREIRLALLEADVNFKVVKQLIERIQEKAVGQQVATALSPGEQVIKIVRDELVETLGLSLIHISRPLLPKSSARSGPTLEPCWSRSRSLP